jgi:hypothetical protein
MNYFAMQDNVLDNQLKLDQSAALQGQTRQRALNAFTDGVGSLMNAPAQNALRDNAVTQSNMQTVQAERAVIAPLLEKVAQSQDPAAAYSIAVRQAEAAGIDIPDGAEVYDPDTFEMMRSVYRMPDAELTDFQRKIALAGPENAREAAMVALGLSPSADAQMRGQVGDRPTTKMREAEAMGLQPGTQAYTDFLSGSSNDFRIETAPDGSTVITRGRQANAPIGRSGQNKIDALEIDTRDELARLERIQASSIENPNVADMNTLTGNLKRMGLEWQDFIASDSLTDEQAQYLVDVTTARGDILENLNFTIKQITGAAMTESEAKRIGATLPNINDSPRMFQAKLDRALERTRASIARYNMWRNQGLDGRPEDLGTLSDIQSQMDKRFDDLAAAVESGDMTAEEANAMFASEFGL